MSPHDATVPQRSGDMNPLWSQVLHEIACRPYAGASRSHREELETGSDFSARCSGAHGEMAEWFKAAVLKTAVGASSPWVRIPLSPPIAAQTPPNSTSVS